MLISSKSVKTGRLHHSQTIRDSKKLEQRIKSNEGKLQFVSDYLDDYFGTHVNTMILGSLAKIIINTYGITLDRLAKRNRTALLCWYAENWEKICPLLNNLCIGKEKDIKLSTEEPIKNHEEFIAISQDPIQSLAPYSIICLLNHH